MPKVIRLKIKETGKKYFFKKYADMYKKFTEDEIGACIGHVWNMVHKNDGNFENKKVIIEKIKID